jgi:hypothetical protein
MTVVDEERRDDARRERDDRQQFHRAPRAPDCPVRHQMEEAGEPEVRRDDHHAEEEHQGLGIDGRDGLLPRQHPGHHHHGRADDGHARPIHAEPWEVAEGRPYVGADERDQRDEAEPGERGYVAEYTAPPGPGTTIPRPAAPGGSGSAHDFRSR